MFALLLEAGLEGIKHQYEIPEVVGGIHQMNTQERKDAGIEVLPSDLNEAIQAAREGGLARRVLGDTLFEKFLSNKKLEWESYRSQASSIRNRSLFERAVTREYSRRFWRHVM